MPDIKIVTGGTGAGDHRDLNAEDLDRCPIQFRDNLSDRTAITARTLPSSSGDDMIQPRKK